MQAHLLEVGRKSSSRFRKLLHHTSSGKSRRCAYKRCKFRRRA